MITKNESTFLTDQFKGRTWDEISKELSWSSRVSHTGYYNDVCYVVLCDRFDKCMKVCVVEQ